MERKKWFVALVGVAMVLIVIEIVVVNIVYGKENEIHDGAMEYISGAEQTSNKWIIVYIKERQHADLGFLKEVYGWNLLVVGHFPHFNDCISPRCTYLHPGNIQHLKFRSTSHVTDSNFHIKNIAYLYAMSKSADYIYDLEYGVRPMNTNTHFIFTGVTDGLIYSGNHTFNYYRYFGQPNLQPRGYPSSNQEQQSNFFKLCSMDVPQIQHGLISGDPFLSGRHVTALLSVTKQIPYDVQFDESSPPVFLPPGKMSVVTSGNTVYGRKALWTMLLPWCRDEFLGGLIRGYVAQRLAWETGDTVGFMGVTGYRKYVQRKITHVSDSRELAQARKLVDLLTHWKCDRKLTAISCFVELFHHLVNKQVIDKANLNVVESWIYDVANVIKVDISERKAFSEPAHSYNRQPCTHVYMSPNTNSHTVYNLSSMSVQRPHGHRNTFCPGSDGIRQALQTTSVPKYYFKDVLLIVIINYHRIYSSIRSVEKVYRRYFPNILYCGPKETSLLAFDKHASVSHVEGIAEGWHYMYQCVALAMKMNYRVNGYLHIGDDTLLYLWNLFPLPRHSVWFPGDLDTYRRSVLDYSWRWWNEDTGRKSMESVFAELQEHSRNGSTNAALANQFFVNYVKNRKNLDMIYGKNCDFYYMPHKLKDMFLYLTSLLQRHGVIIEVGLPTIVHGLDVPENIKLLPGKGMFGPTRNKIAELFTTDDYFMHPVKFTPMLRIPGKMVFFCDKILPLLEGNIHIMQSNASLL